MTVVGGATGGGVVVLTYQLPADRDVKPICSSTMFQAYREAEAQGLYRPGTGRDGYVGWLLARRRAQEAERAVRRERREARWSAIARGDVPPLTPEQADALWSNLPDAPHITERRSKKAAAGLALAEPVAA